MEKLDYSKIREIIFILILDSEWSTVLQNIFSVPRFCNQSIVNIFETIIWRPKNKSLNFSILFIIYCFFNISKIVPRVNLYVNILLVFQSIYTVSYYPFIYFTWYNYTYSMQNRIEALFRTCNNILKDNHYYKIKFWAKMSK